MITFLTLLLVVLGSVLAVVAFRAAPRVARRHVAGIGQPVRPGSSAPFIQSGRATLVAGVGVTIGGAGSNLELQPSQRILVSHNTVIGTPGWVSAPTATRVAGGPGVGAFDIVSTNALDASVVEWAIMPRDA